jgi:glycosyl-4,4'-diaponeurosporenoate acyltransferase
MERQENRFEAQGKQIMLLHLPSLPTIFLDIAIWMIIHMGVSYLMTHIPLSSFDNELWLYKQRKWEKDGKIYVRIFRLKKWKKRLPDGAALFKKGFQKKHLKGFDDVYIDDFIRETCRAEFTHWIMLLISPVFFIWNIWWVGIVMIVYAILVNLPCIIIQRYNRVRLRRVYSWLTSLSV